MNSELFIKGFRLNRNGIADPDVYPFAIPVIRDMTEVAFNSPVTFLVGENGSGKSTVMEALAVCSGLSAEGGTANMVYETIDTTSCLHEHLTLYRSGRRPKWKFFLRAESFYTMANDYELINLEAGYSDSWHDMSHGEAFFKLFDGFSGGGLYMMDEPESALSPKNLMRLLTLMRRHVGLGSQFIISTHSPIILAYPDCEILNADDGLRPIAYKDTEIYQIYKRFLDCPEKMLSYLFDE